MLIDLVASFLLFKTYGENEKSSKGFRAERTCGDLDQALARAGADVGSLS